MHCILLCSVLKSNFFFIFYLILDFIKIKDSWLENHSLNVLEKTHPLTLNDINYMSLKIFINVSNQYQITH